MKSKKLVAFAATLCLLIGTWGGGVSVSAASDIKGDMDADGIIDMRDMALLFAFVSGREEPTPDQQTAGDIHEDGVLDMLDMSLLYGWPSGLYGQSEYTDPRNGICVKTPIENNPQTTPAPVVIRSVEELQAYVQQENTSYDCDYVWHGYASLNEVAKLYDEAFFEKYVLISAIYICMDQYSCVLQTPEITEDTVRIRLNTYNTFSWPSLVSWHLFVPVVRTQWHEGMTVERGDPMMVQ